MKLNFISLSLSLFISLSLLFSFHSVLLQQWQFTFVFLLCLFHSLFPDLHFPHSRRNFIRSYKPALCRCQKCLKLLVPAFQASPFLSPLSLSLSQQRFTPIPADMENVNTLRFFDKKKNTFNEFSEARDNDEMETNWDSDFGKNF